MSLSAKACSNCGERKLLVLFPHNRTQHDGRGSRCTLCHRARQRELDRGERQPRFFGPVREPEEWEIFWAAGFLEGDGSFDVDNRYLRVRADQVDPEPLTRLHEIFGGWMGIRGKPTSAGNTVHRWSLSGVKAEALADLIYPYLTKRRQIKIDSARYKEEAA